MAMLDTFYSTSQTCLGRSRRKTWCFENSFSSKLYCYTFLTTGMTWKIARSMWLWSTNILIQIKHELHCRLLCDSWFLTIGLNRHGINLIFHLTSTILKPIGFICWNGLYNTYIILHLEQLYIFTAHLKMRDTCAQDHNYSRSPDAFRLFGMDQILVLTRG